MLYSNCFSTNKHNKGLIFSQMFDVKIYFKVFKIDDCVKAEKPPIFWKYIFKFILFL